MMLLYVPFGTEEEAMLVAATLLEEKRIACANVLPSTSIYRWEGAVKRENEVVALFKTRDDLADACEKRILELHSYDTPAIIRIVADANSAFDLWVEQETMD